LGAENRHSGKKLVFLPHSLYLFFWDIINFACIIFSVFLVPIEMVIKENFKQILDENYTSVIYFCIGVFLFDMLLKLFTAYYDKGILIVSHWKIIERFFKRQFLIDALPIIPIFFSIFNEFTKVHFLIFLKIIPVY
jgi:hypothetical protein